MMNLMNLKSLLGKSIKRIFLIVFPPYGEENVMEIDIRLGLVLDNNDNELVIIGIDSSDIWTPVITTEIIPTLYYENSDFKVRISEWMNQELDEEFTNEYYDFTNYNGFINITNEIIMKIELVYVENNSEPFGIKLSFKKDYILIIPNSDGTSIETIEFNRNGLLNNFRNLGNIVFSNIY
jgi:hypothetical protein